MMKTLTIQLPSEIAEYVQGLLEKKAFDSVDALMASAVCCLENAMATEEGVSDELRSDIQQGIDELNRGESVDGPAFMTELLTRFRTRTRASA